ncbi:MAG: efflux RND transporter periplasmic adaptor subunit, partial [Pseudomonadota bacterium]
PRPFEATVAEAGARLEQAEAARRLADAELERARQLLDRGHVSQSVYDTRQREAENAVAAIAAARAALDRARLDLGFTRIHAPVTGRISDDAVSPGNLISGGAGSGALTTIVSLDPIHFVFDATEQQYLEYMRATTSGGLRQRAAKTPVAVRLVDEADFTHPGVIDFVDNRIDRATGTIRGRAVLDNAKGMLTPGMFGRLRLATEENAETVLVPERAIGSDQTRKFVWVVRADDTVERRLVRIGERAGGLTVIEAGLEAGERVIVSGLHRVAEGAAVTPVPEREPERTVAVATR